MFWLVSRWFPFPSSCWTHKRTFLHVHCENLVERQEVKLTTAWEPFSDWVPLKCLPLRGVQEELPTVCLCEFSFPGRTLVPADTALASCDSLYLPVGLSNLGAAVCPGTSLLFHT